MQSCELYIIQYSLDVQKSDHSRFSLDDTFEKTTAALDAGQRPSRICRNRLYAVFVHRYHCSNIINRYPEQNSAMFNDSNLTER